MSRSTTSSLLAFVGFVSLSASQGAASQQVQPQPARPVSIAAIPGVVSASSEWQLVWAGTDNADGLVGLPDGGLLFAQEQPSRVRRLAVDGSVSVHVEDTEGAGALAIDTEGRIIAAQRTCTDPGLIGPCIVPTKIGVLFPLDRRRTLADNFAGATLGRVNDLVVDRRGGVYFTSGGAFYAGPQAEVVAMGDLRRTNGIMLSPDEATLYVTNGPVVVAFDRLLDGRVVNPRKFSKLEAGSTGDGMTVDAAGRLYVTSQPGVQVFAEDGAYLGLIPTPRNAISVAFSGPDKQVLYIVGSGALDERGQEIRTAESVRNNAKSIFRIAMIAKGFEGRAK